MPQPVQSPFLVPFDGSFSVADAPTSLPGGPLSKKAAKKELSALQEELEDLQRCLFAQDKFSLLLVFQAMDAAGKDSTIRAVMSGVNPAGCEVHSFKKPSAQELDHDFLWRSACRLPERGRIGIFNRSYYEEVLVVRVRPELLAYQRLPDTSDLPALFEGRYASIRDNEAHLARNGTVVVKFWLNVSRDEQRRRFLSRIDEADKNWKFASGDVRERARWPEYMAAYEDALNETSRPSAPWYAIPADDKPTMRVEVARIVVDTLKGMDLAYPTLPAHEMAELSELRAQLVAED